MELELLDSVHYKPSYQRYSLVNVSNAILKHFGCETLHPAYPFEEFLPGILDGVKKILIFLIDALGYHSLEKVASKEIILNNVNILKATSVFPTTTSSSLSSLLTGCTPIEHGMLGYVLYLKEVGGLVNMIELSSPTLGKLPSSVPPKSLMFSETIFEKLTRVGTRCFVLTSKTIRGSGFSNLTHAGASVKSYQSFGDLIQELAEIIEIDGNVFGFVYWGLLDSIGHKKGADSKAFETELYWLLKMCDKEVFPLLKGDTMLIIMGDHGQIVTPWQNEIWWSWKDPVARHFWMAPGGEMRMMHIYTKHPEEVIEYLQSEYNDKASFYTKQQAVELGLFGFGEIKQEALDRIGDVVLIAKGNYSFYFKLTGREESLKSKHGALSLEELLIPLIIFRR
ncbi:alkaline phosphatase family protein [Pseudothermotoga thermarum]|uniref:Type I phosphodiesterase/nucleotide pyrophosphatase n=1 Tax=Pseudothermotoga thermarum DSM 5069 TaxID=688269 RepID=F7YU84_9THEM|nr:alkaline phosphatase family protein [Pseudothermotoga thermarum]AEH50180.1 type I phosphodiesterase/nucleotide pyrophosphatase [Pseudothermotoga thermarum DSM 5069]